MDKKTARKHALEIRKNLSNRIEKKLIINQIIKSINSYNNIGIYYPLNNEIDVMDIIKLCPNKSFYLPITREEISFIKYNHNDKLIDGLFHTKEPVGQIVSRDTIDCFIIPCVAISNDNRRVGYRKGYYDRYLANYSGHKIGVCYKECVNLDITTDEFDVILDEIIVG